MKDLNPDIVTISFGRNDHTALENADKERMAADLSPFAKRIYLVLTRRTLGRLILHMVDRGHMMTTSRPKGQKNVERVIRVHPEDYVNNNQVHSTTEFAQMHDQYAEFFWFFP